MATQQTLDRFETVREKFKKIVEARLLRPELGTVSLAESSGFITLYKDIAHKFAFAASVAPLIDDNSLQSVATYLDSICDQLIQQMGYADEAYVNSRADLIRYCESNLNGIRQNWPPFVTTAIEQRGILDQSTSEKIKSESDAGLEKIRDEAQKIINKATEAANLLKERIESQARLTASGISVEEAQKQFKEAQNNLLVKVIGWSILSAVGFSGFMWFAHNIYTANHSDIAKQDHWETIYLAVIRVTILTALAAATTFCLKMLRAHMHMHEYNLHRQRVANCMSAFVAAANSPEQRDQILGRLVDAVVAFGNSGLLDSKEDSLYAPKMTIDAIMKSLPKE